MERYPDHARPPVPMTDEQKFFFDLRGWLVLPSVLSGAELEAMRAECYAGVDPLQERSGGAKDGHSGVLQTLLDHPAVIGVLSDILSEEPFDREECYGFRCEDSHVIMRPPGWSKTRRGDKGMPHVVRPPQMANAMRYQVAGNKIFSGLTRLVWELEEVQAGHGGTSFLSGSHKAHFSYGGPDRFASSAEGSPWLEGIYDAMDTYGCPAGSVVIFTESLLHAANDWTNPDNGRCAIFQCYNRCGRNGIARTSPPSRYAPETAHAVPRRLATRRQHRLLRRQPHRDAPLAAHPHRLTPGATVCGSCGACGAGWLANRAGYCLLAHSVGVQVTGNSGSGKTTFAARLAKALDAEFVDLDALNWEPGWTALNESDPDELERRFRAATAGECWVASGSYPRFCQRTFWPRLTIVWLDLPMPLCVWRLSAVPGGAGRSKELLWGTNYERLWISCSGARTAC